MEVLANLQPIRKIKTVHGFYFKDAETGVDCEVINSEQLADWLLLNFKKYGINIELITDKSSEGN